jgi:hypothetical protein
MTRVASRQTENEKHGKDQETNGAEGAGEIVDAPNHAAHNAKNFGMSL